MKVIKELGDRLLKAEGVASNQGLAHPSQSGCNNGYIMNQKTEQIREVSCISFAWGEGTG